MSGFDQNSIAVPLPTVTGTAAALAGPYRIKPSEAFSSALVTISGLTGETVSFETSPDGYWGAPASPTFYKTDWQGTQRLFSTARTNRILRSADLSSASWTKTNATIGASAVLAPDGVSTMQTVTDTAINAIHAAAQNVTIGASPSTFSVFLKAGTKTWGYLRWEGGSAYINLSNGVVGTTTGSSTVVVTPYANSIYRVSISRTDTIALKTFGVYVANGDTANTYLGDGTGFIYAWGAQVEDGATATPYIPTVASQVTVTDYTISGGIITLAVAPVAGATLSYDNGVLPSPYFVFATGDGTRTTFAYDGVWGTLTANAGKGNGIFQIDLRGAQAFKLTKSAGSETATVNMTLKRDALQYTNTAGTWTVT